MSDDDRIFDNAASVRAREEFISAMPKTDKELFRIKPLEWEWNGTWFIASTPLFNYVVGNRLTVYNKLQDELKSQPCASPEEGKQLAEQHWREYIKQALVEVQ